MRILVTGHRGYIGSALFKALKKATRNKQDKYYTVKGIDLVEGQDLLTCELPTDFDTLIHLAGKSGVRESMDDPAAYWMNNVEVGRRLFERFPRKRILYASSSSMYEPDLNPYAASKFLLEEIGQRHTNSLAMRFHTVWSNHPRKGMFIDKLRNGTLEYTTNHYRDFIHQEDVIDAIMLCIESNYKGTIDIGTGCPFRIRDFAPDLPIRLNTPHERNWTCADTTRLKTLGWKPKHSIEKYLTNKDLGNIINFNNGEPT